VKSVQITPTDVWLFRDGKPFNADSDHRARSMFPPLPTVTQGLLRAHFLANEGKALRDNDKAKMAALVGTATDFGNLRLRGPFVRYGTELCFALPAEVVKGSDGWFYPLSVYAQMPSGAAFSHPSEAPYALLPDTTNEQLKKPQKIEEDWVTQSHFNLYLRGQPFRAIKSSCLFSRETRPGNAIESGKQTTREGYLYQVEFLRLCDKVSLQIDVVAGFDKLIRTNGLMRVGGEGHAARFDVKSNGPPDVPLPAIGNRKRFKLVLLTPTYLEQGWLPKNNDWSQYFDNGNVVLKAAAIKKYISIGGFDLLANDHKPALRYVDAGSVYYFEVTDGQPEFKKDRIWLCDVAPNGASLGHIGFGQVSVGDWVLGS
jgi:CRISPR-associated protein Cmr3